MTINPIGCCCKGEDDCEHDVTNLLCQEKVGFIFHCDTGEKDRQAEE